ncbi:MAG: hypothetical protein QW390_05310, partial [Candidatus Bathyarchaeia archaeon]
NRIQGSSVRITYALNGRVSSDETAVTDVNGEISMHWLWTQGHAGSWEIFAHASKEGYVSASATLTVTVNPKPPSRELIVDIRLDKADGRYMVGELFSGKVLITDAENHPVPSVSLQIKFSHQQSGEAFEYAGTADEDGLDFPEWAWSADHIGTWILEVTASKENFDDGYAIETIAVEPAGPGPVGKLEVHIETKTQYVVGEPFTCTITVQEGGKPVKDARVRVGFHIVGGGRREEVSTTDEDGRLTVGWVWKEGEEGTWLILVSASADRDGESVEGFGETRIEVNPKEETGPKPTDLDRELALEVLGSKVRLWLPPESDLEGDEIRAIHYRVHRYPDGYTYITYIVDWNMQRGEYLGHSFDYEPIVVVLDEMGNVRQVYYDAGHYAKGRISVETDAGPINLVINEWSHNYNYVDKVGENGYSPLDIDKLTREEGIQGLHWIKFSEWTEESMKEMNQKLEEVIPTYPFIGPRRLSLLPLYNDPRDHCRDKVFGYGNPLYDYGGQIHLSRDTTLPIGELPEGIPITTGPDSIANVKGDASTIDVGPESIFIFEDDQSSKLCFGKVHIESKTESNVETPNSLIRSKGTEYEIIADLEQTKILVYQGSVEVSDRNLAATIVVNAGEASTVEADSAPAQPVPFDRELVEKWWEKETASLTATEITTGKVRVMPISFEGLLISMAFIAFIIVAVRRAVSKRKTLISATTRTQPSIGVVFCEECGSAIPPGSEFCPHCGDRQGAA